MELNFFFKSPPWRVRPAKAEGWGGLTFKINFLKEYGHEFLLRIPSLEGLGWVKRLK